MILRLFIICPPIEICADPLKLSIDYTQNHMKRLKGMTFIMYSTWDKPSIFWHFFCILLVLCIWLPKICFIKYHTVHIVLHKCNYMPVLELRVISILSCASVVYIAVDLALCCEFFRSHHCFIMQPLFELINLLLCGRILLFWVPSYCSGTKAYCYGVKTYYNQ